MLFLSLVDTSCSQIKKPLMEGRQQQQRVILVTGGNRGIGFCVVKKLLADSASYRDIILLGCRELQRGEDALVKLGSPANVHLLQLDMLSVESILYAVGEISQKYAGSLDVIINNAGVLDREMSVDRARQTFATNYYGVKLLNDQLLPILRENGRIINVSSQVGPLVLEEVSEALQQKYTSPTLTIEELDQLVEDFISAIGTNTLESLGYCIKSFPAMYGISKAALNALSQVEARQWSETKNVLVVSVSPGFCATDMTENASTARSPEIGADSVLHALYTPQHELVSGGFYRDGHLLPLIGTTQH